MDVRLGHAFAGQQSSLESVASGSGQQARDNNNNDPDTIHAVAGR
jgi:hypothetical protein